MSPVAKAIEWMNEKCCAELILTSNRRWKVLQFFNSSNFPGDQLNDVANGVNWL